VKLFQLHQIFSIYLKKNYFKACLFGQNGLKNDIRWRQAGYHQVTEAVGKPVGRIMDTGTGKRVSFQHAFFIRPK
jgi:hypothetical protein